MSGEEVFPWLKSLPLAPEYHPTLQDFQDPISFIFKIEQHASQYGICKIIPPFPSLSKKHLLSSLSHSLSSQNDHPTPPTFTTRHQQIGFSPRKQRPVQKSVWQSGETYTVPQFEAKAKAFEKQYLKKCSSNKRISSFSSLSPLEVETMYWKANGDKPFYVEYANDMAGSGFRRREGEGGGGSATSVGESEWNMRGVARAKGSLLRFMKEDIPGVTTPMVYLAMLFSWFAWHVEDHDLHSLNYLHFGASKTWYGVPRDAAAAFEEVVRVYGFGEEINPLVTFATLKEKTTVMSPEVLIKAGVPCCRLVQNVGEFVVTFPRAYHCGFSHGFNCGEASNIATPEWLKFAKEAAIRRASINYPPMVSHFQLLYDLALDMCARGPTDTGSAPRSSRLKDKKKGEGETLVKQVFVQDVMQNNELLYALGQGSEVVLLPHNSSEKFICSNLRVGSKYKVKPGLPFSLYSSEEAIKASDDIMLARDGQKGRRQSQISNDSMSTFSHDAHNSESERGENAGGDGLSKRGLFSCVKCGIWTFACVAIVQPTEPTAQYLMSAESGFLDDWAAGSGLSSHVHPSERGSHSLSGSMEKNGSDELFTVLEHSADDQIQSMDITSANELITAETTKAGSSTEKKFESSALGLLAMTYGNSSDSDEDDVLASCPVVSEDNISGDGSWGAKYNDDAPASPASEQGYHSGVERGSSQLSSRSGCEDEQSSQRFDLSNQRELRRCSSDECGYETHNCSARFTEEDTMTSEQIYSPAAYDDDTGKISNANTPVAKPKFPFASKCDEDSSRMHVFCLEHAVEVEKQLRPFGGVHILLLCHPDYPKVECEAKKVAEELDIHCDWKDVPFSEASKEDEEQIQLALQSEEVTPKNGDWAVKLGINLFYSAILSRSPLYNKQMPYNSVIYSAFGCSSPSKPSPEVKVHGKGVGRQKKLVMAGKWCGKVWMSNQVHPLLVQRDLDDEEKTVDTFPKVDGRIGRNSGTISKASAASASKQVGRKRKSKVKNTRTKKLKFEAQEFADSDQEGLADEKPVPLPRKRARKPKRQFKSVRKAKPQEDEIPESGSEGSTEDEPHRGPWRSSRLSLTPVGKPSPRMKVQKRVAINSYSDDSLSDVPPPHLGRRTNTRKTKGALKPCQKVKGRQKEIVNSESEASLNDGSPDEDSLGPSISECHTPKEFGPLSEDDEMEGGPSRRLRKRPPREIETKSPTKKKAANSKGKKALPIKSSPARKGPKMRLPTPRAPAMKGPARKGLLVNTDADVKDDEEEEEEEVEEEDAGFKCDVEGCTMSFGSKQELSVHKRNICPVKGCNKTFFSHKYLVQHRRVHMDDRPLKCPWKGCRMTFKWAWARTEHIRVHTGARPYVCNEPGCGQTFRFVSDFSRHKRKTGHSAKKKK